MSATWQYMGRDEQALVDDITGRVLATITERLGRRGYYFHMTLYADEASAKRAAERAVNDQIAFGMMT